MFKSVASGAIAVLLVAAASVSVTQARSGDRTLAVTMTNDPQSNQVRVYDASTGALVQTLSAHGKGGAAGNARGVRQYDGEVFAAVNTGSNTVAIFTRDGDRLRFDKVVSTTSAPVSIDFGNDHMYVAGATSVDSFAMRHDDVLWMDGTTGLELAGGDTPPAGSTAQVGVVSDRQLLVTLKADPDPGTVDVVSLRSGAVSGARPAAVSAPAGTLTPFGFSVYRDGSALITLAHSNHDGVFRDGAFVAVTAAGQAAPCWTTRVGKYVFTANAGSRTIGRVVGTGQNAFVDAAAAATIVTGGGPADLDASDGILGVVDHGGGQSHLSLFSYNQFGELATAGAPITVGVPDANGIAILPPAGHGRR
jgi:hypothetical protein